MKVESISSKKKKGEKSNTKQKCMVNSSRQKKTRESPAEKGKHKTNP